MGRSLLARSWLGLSRFWDRLLALGEGRGVLLRLLRPLWRPRPRSKPVGKGRVTLQADALESRLVPTVVTFPSSNYYVSEGTAHLDIPVTLDVSSIDTVTADWHFESTLDTYGNPIAVTGTDFVAHSGTVTFPPGNTLQTITFDPLDDTLNTWVENDKLVLIKVDSAVNASPGSGANLFILDNDSPPVVQFDRPVYKTSEGKTTVTLTAILTGNKTEHDLWLDWSTADGTAFAYPHAPYDYFATGATGDPYFQGGRSWDSSNFPNNRSVNLTVYLSNDDVREKDETFSASITIPSGYASDVTLGANSTAAVRIVDDDWPQKSMLGCCTGTGNNQLSTPVDRQVCPPGIVAQVCGQLVLIYFSNSDPFAVISQEIPSDSGRPLFESISATLTLDGGPSSGAHSFSTAGHTAGDVFVVGLLADVSGQPTGRQGYTIDVTLTWNSSYAIAPESYSVSGVVDVVNNEDSPWGPGWSLNGVPHLYPVSGEGATLELGNGMTAYFAEDGSGDFSSTNSSAALARQMDGSYVLNDGEFRTSFSAQGLAQAFVDPTGTHRRTYTYDGLNRLTHIVDEDNDWTLSYDGGGHVSAIDLGGGRTVTYSRDSHGNATQIASPGGVFSTYTFDSGNRVLTSTIAGAVATYTYTGEGMLSQVDQGGGDVRDISPALRRAMGSTALTTAEFYGTSTAPGSAVTQDFYDGSGRLLQRVYPDSASEEWTYDSLSNVLTYTDPLGRTTTYGYATGTRDVTEVDYPDGASASIEYDTTYHKPTLQIDALGRRTTSVYDAGTGALLSVTDPLGATTTYTYSSGLLATATDPLLRRTTYLYNAAHRLETVISPDGLRTTSLYDSAGDLTETVTPDGARTTVVYDAGRKPVATHAPDGSTTTIVYDSYGRAQASIDAFGNRTTAVYDAFGRVTAVVDPDGHRATTVYDSAGHVTATIDVYGDRTTYLYDTRGRQTEVVDPYGNHATTVFDAANEVIATVDAYGHRTTFLYDLRGRQTAALDFYGHTATTLYDADDEITETIDVHGNVTDFAYDDAGQPTAVVDPFGNRTTTLFDAAGAVTATIDAYGQRTTFLYDNAARLTTTIDVYGHRSTLAYNAKGQVSEATDLYGHTTTILYDAIGRATTSIDVHGNRTTSLYDSHSQVTEVADALGRTTMQYDGRGRVTARIDALGGRTTTVYDSFGRVQETDTAAGRATLLYDSHGRWTASLDALNRRSMRSIIGARWFTTAAAGGRRRRTRSGTRSRPCTIRTAACRRASIRWDGGRRRCSTAMVESRPRLIRSAAGSRAFTTRKVA